MRWVGKFGAHRKSKRFDHFRRDSACSHNRGTLFIWNKKVIGAAAVPDCVDRDRVGDNDNALASSVRSQNLLEQIGIGRENGNDHVGPKAGEQRGEMLLELRESPETFVEVLFPIEPPVNVAPGARPTIDHCQIGFADEFIERPIALGKEIAQLDLDVGGDPRQSIADAAGGAVVTFPITSGEKKDFFHSSLGKRNGRKFNGYLQPAK